MAIRNFKAAMLPDIVALSIVVWTPITPSKFLIFFLKLEWPWSWKHNRVRSIR